jgi:hypothetical protein
VGVILGLTFSGGDKCNADVILIGLGWGSILGSVGGTFAKLGSGARGGAVSGAIVGLVGGYATAPYLGGDNIFVGAIAGGFGSLAGAASGYCLRLGGFCELCWTVGVISGFLVAGLPLSTQIPLYTKVLFVPASGLIYAITLTIVMRKEKVAGSDLI